MTKRPAGSLSHTKALMRDMERIAAQMSRESALFRERLQTAEAREAFAAFAECRKPDFSKRLADAAKRRENPRASAVTSAARRMFNVVR